MKHQMLRGVWQNVNLFDHVQTLHGPARIIGWSSRWYVCVIGLLTEETVVLDASDIGVLI